MKKCRICGWIGRCHRHHIIPLSEGGRDSEDNIIILCPNHHSDAYGNHEHFNERYNLKGKKNSEERIKAIRRVGILLSDRAFGDGEEKKDEELYLMVKYNITSEEAISYLMRITEASFCNVVGESYQVYKRRKERFLEICELKRKELNIPKGE